MFSVGESVIYGVHGVSIIKEICELKLTEKETLYYILEPAFDEKSVFYVPVEKAEELGNIRRVLKKEEFEELFVSAGKTEFEWIADDSARKEFCRKAIKSGRREDVIAVIRMLYLKQQELKETGRHFHIADEKNFKVAERLLHEEIAYVFSIPIAEVPRLIQNKI